MRKFDTKQLTLAAVIAAAYAALTLCLPAYGAIQVRLSEAFTVLPFLFPAAVPVGLGELVACYGLGLPILIALPKIPYFQGRMSPERLS